MMWDAVSDSIQDNGSQVLLGAKVECIRWSQDRVEALEVLRNGNIEVVSGTDFISSMPIKDAIQKFKPAVIKKVLDAANDLKYRDFLTVALIINKRDLFPDNWIYIHDPSVKVGRIQNFKNWSPYMVPNQEKTCLGLEYFCFEGDALWDMPDDQLIELGKSELEALGFVNPVDVEDGAVVRMLGLTHSYSFSALASSMTLLLATSSSIFWIESSFPALFPEVLASDTFFRQRQP